MFKKIILGALSIAFLAASCSDDDDTTVIVANAGEISGGPFTFTVDGVPDMVSGITLDSSESVGSSSSWVVTDDQGEILGLPGTLADLEGVNFDDAGVGVCLIWYARYEGEVTGLEMGLNANDVEGNFALSNSLTVNRVQGVNAGTISGGPFEFNIDGEEDLVSGITLDSSGAIGENSTWVITDDMGNILGLPPTLADVEGVDFDGAGVGVCLIWYARYDGDVTGLAMGQNANDIQGNFALSNSITVNRVCGVEAGVIAGGPFEFSVDGEEDFVSGITLDDSNALGSNSTWVITDDTGNILGLPGTLTDVEGVNFDEAGEGVCLIWYLRYEGELQGAEMGMNANDIEGCFALSNSITVNRVCEANAGVISGGPFEFTVDGTPDMVTGITLDSSQSSGDNSTWVITDDMGNILGLPSTLADVKNVDFDEAGVGVCLIWYLRYNGDIEGAEMDMNANDIQGCFSLSNSITVNRVQ